jgi:hypothetical protein
MKSLFIFLNNSVDLKLYIKYIMRLLDVQSYSHTHDRLHFIHYLLTAFVHVNL